MASDAAQQDPADHFRPYTGASYREREVLVPADRFDEVAAEVSARLELGLAELERRAGIVRAELVGDTDDDVGTLVDRIRLARREAGEDERAPRISPVHAVTVGQPNVVGNAEDVLPRTATSPLPDRSGQEGENARIAIVDTGIQTHPWLGSDYRAQPGDRERQVMVRYGDRDVLGPQAGHCVFLAGLVLRHAPAAKILVLKTADSFGRSDIIDVAAAIELAARRGATVINLSLGCFTRHRQPPWTLEQALGDLERRHPDVAVVASAGNAGTEQEFWPAAFEQVTAVGALANQGGWKLADYTNRGAWVDVFVPATDVLSTYIQYSGPAVYADGARLLDKWVDHRTGWATWSGTSMASAIWAGAIARAAGVLGCSAAEAASALRSSPPELDFLTPLTLVPADQLDPFGRPRRAFDVAPAVTWS
jgi:subtilisin family serine protease